MDIAKREIFPKYRNVSLTCLAAFWPSRGSLWRWQCLCQHDTANSCFHFGRILSLFSKVKMFCSLSAPKFIRIDLYVTARCALRLHEQFTLNRIYFCHELLSKCKCCQAAVLCWSARSVNVSKFKAQFC